MFVSPGTPVPFVHTRIVSAPNCVRCALSPAAGTVKRAGCWHCSGVNSLKSSQHVYTSFVLPHDHSLPNRQSPVLVRNWNATSAPSSAIDTTSVTSGPRCTNTHLAASYSVTNSDAATSSSSSAANSRMSYKMSATNPSTSITPYTRDDTMRSQ